MDISVYEQNQVWPQTSRGVGLAQAIRDAPKRLDFDEEIGKGFDARAVYSHSFESATKVVSDELSGEVLSSSQLHGTAGTLRCAGIQRRLNICCVVCSVWWRNPNCRAVRVCARRH